MATAISNFAFVPETHTYLKDGKRILSVTQILQASGLVCYDHIPAAILDHKAEIGTAAHAAAYYHDEGDLDWSTVSPEVLPYLEAWQRFRKESSFIAREGGMEQRGIATMDGMDYGYTYDRDGFLNGKPVVIELKCTANVEISWGPQTAAYEHALRQKDDIIRKRIAVHLRPNGSYSLVEFREVRDYQLFKAALFVQTWKISKGKSWQPQS